MQEYILLRRAHILDWELMEETGMVPIELLNPLMQLFTDTKVLGFGMIMNFISLLTTLPDKLLSWM